MRLLFVSEPDEFGIRLVTFELNGQSRQVRILDKSKKTERPRNQKAEKEKEVGAPLQGLLAKILVKTGDKVKPNTPLFVIEAMKMESTVTSVHEGTILGISLKEGTLVEQDDCVLEIG